MSAKLRLTNPNSEPMRILGYDYEMSLEGAELVQGQSVAAITLPAGGESVVEVPILLKLTAVPKALSALLLKEKLNYELSGGFRLASLLGGLKVPFRFRGEITRQEGLESLRGFLDSKKKM
jgi:LEA14-like dessication related protein